MLEVQNLSVHYGLHPALQDVSLTVQDAELVVMLGANGAGKSSLLRALGGMQPVQNGASVRLDGVELTALAAHQRVEHGLALVPEGRGIFAALTVRENLLLGALPRRARQYKGQEQANLARALALFPRLSERMGQRAGSMSGGEQQMVAVARALMSAPKLLLLDEPSLGLSPLICQELFAVIAQIRQQGTGVLMVEQNAHVSLSIANRAYLLETGRIQGSGPAARLRDDPLVQKVYLGQGHV